MPQETPPAQLDDVIVTGTRRAPESSDGSWLRDFFGFDSGRFLLSDFGIGGSSHLVISGAGGTVAIPLDEEGRPMIGVQIGVDINVTDGDVGVSVGPGVGLDSPEPGPYVDGLTAGYWWTVPETGGGLGLYPVPGGDHGEYYWGPPPGSDLGPPLDF